MIKKLLVLFFFSLLTMSLFGKVTTKIIGNDINDEYVCSIVATPDNGYIIGGHVRVNNKFDFFIAKLTGCGHIEWYKIHYQTDDYYLNELIRTEDGGYAAVGTMSFNTVDVTSGFIVKFDETGDVAWLTGVSIENSNSLESIKQTEDGGYIVCGDQPGIFPGGQSPLYARLDAQGNTQWINKSLLYSATLYDVQITKDDGYIMVGHDGNKYSSDGMDPFTMTIIKTDQAGTEKWSYKLRDSKATSVILAPDDGFYVTGLIIKETPMFKFYNAFLMKLSGDGKAEWRKTYGDDKYTNNVFFDVAIKRNGSLILAGRKNYGYYNSNRFWVVETDSNGEVVNEVGTGSWFGKSITLNENGYVVAGWSYQNTSYDITLFFNEPEATYKTSTKTLFIPSVTVDDETKYEVELIHDPVTGTFSIKSAIPIE